MAIVTSFRFTEKSGAICIDQESWHIWRRKNWFSDHLFVLVPEPLADKFNIELVYGGIGHPAFHLETARIAQKKIAEYLANPNLDQDTITVERLGKCVLEAFREVHLRRINDKLTYLYGFNLDEFNACRMHRDGQSFDIRQKEVIQRAKRIVQNDELVGYSPLSPAVEACLIGVDPKYGFSAFALKEKDGVLGFQSCWFESLGQGRDGATIRFAKLLNNRFLDSRRTGEGFPDGMFHLLDAISESMDHYGQNGGFVRMIMIDADAATRSERIRDIRDDRARLCVEIIRTYRAGMVPKETALRLLSDAILEKQPLEQLERQLFNSVDDINLLGKLLRGYKIEEPGLPSHGPETQLFSIQTASSVSFSGGAE